MKGTISTIRFSLLFMATEELGAIIMQGREMRALFITRKWPPAVGGMEVYCVELTAELKREVDLTVQALPGRRDGQPPRAAALIWFFLRQALFIARNRNDYDVIHYGDFVLFPLAWLCHTLGRTGRQVISAHGTDVAYGIRQGWRPALYRRFMSWAARNQAALDVIICNSAATANMCRRHGLTKLAIVKLGVRRTDHVDESPGIENYLLFVGRVARRKGVAWFINQVLPALPSNIRLKVAGTIWDKEENQALTDPRVDYLGPIFGEELSRLRRKALAVIMPNIPVGGHDFEGFGLTALEAGADGAVLLASALDGIADAVEDGVTGILVEPECPAAWVERINQLGTWSAHERSGFLQRARERIANYYNWERVCLETIQLYQASET